MTAEDGTAPAESGDRKHDYRVTMMYHPSHHVLDLGDAELWFERVFGRTSTSIIAVLGEAPAGSGRRNDYSTFTPINDVLFDTIDPRRYILGGVQRYPSVKHRHPHRRRHRHPPREQPRGAVAFRHGTDAGRPARPLTTAAARPPRPGPTTHRRLEREPL